MGRYLRLSGTKIYHHIYAWGNNRQPVFLAVQHYRRYLQLLETYSKEYRVDIVAYALMQTHIHLFVFDLQGRVSLFVNSLHGDYARYFNRVTDRIGHVFGERFNNKVVQVNEYGLWLSRYIHRQAVAAGLVKDPRHYPWTSYQIYLGEASLGFVKPDIILGQFGNEQERINRYEAFVKGSNDGPIDWDARSTGVIGDEDLKRQVRKLPSAESQGSIDDKQIHELIGTHFKLESELPLVPHGREERSLRRDVIRYLVDEAGLTPRRVAQFFDISPMTVHRALNRKC